MRSGKRFREFMVVLGVVGVVASGVVACVDRSPVEIGRDGALPDLGGNPKIDRGVTPPSVCTCLDWNPIGTSCTFDFDWGCKEAPQHFGVAGLPDPCLKVVRDPKTGCKMPVQDDACTVSCPSPPSPPPPPPPPASVIGRPCTAEGGECGAKGVCVLTDPLRGGVCTVSCKPDDPNTKLVNEDTCPDLSQHVCGTITLAKGSIETFCFQTCDPKHGANDCASPLACNPASGALVGLHGRAVCLLVGCQTGADCPVSTATPCTLGGPKTCGPSERCLPSRRGSKEGVCAREGTCDQVSGLCAPRTHDFSKTARVGDPCTSDLDCGANQRCEREANLAMTKKAAGASCRDARECCSGVCASKRCAAGLCPVHARNGYCVVEGCAFKTFKSYQCPPGSACNRVFAAGLCQRECDLTKKGSCRGHRGDKLGDYECRAWNNISIGGQVVAGAPVCDFGDQLRCNSYTHLGCSAVGLQSNATHMTCRNLKGVALQDPHSSEGFCLDDTASGPVAP